MDIDKLFNQLVIDEGTGPTVNTPDGKFFKPYKDTVGKLTIGYGLNLDDVGLSESCIKFETSNRIDKVINDLNKHLSWHITLNDVRQRVLANMCFNLGIHSLLGFTHMLKALEDKNYEEAARQMESSLWAKQVGIRANRLVFMMRSGQDVE